MLIVPDAPTDGNQTDADADICEQVNGSLHRISDGEISVLTLIEITHQKNARGKTDHLHGALNEDEVADHPRAVKSATNRGR